MKTLAKSKTQKRADRRPRRAAAIAAADDNHRTKGMTCFQRLAADAEAARQKPSPRPTKSRGG